VQHVVVTVYSKVSVGLPLDVYMYIPIYASCLSARSLARIDCFSKKNVG